jgi:hypothetical protein
LGCGYKLVLGRSYRKRLILVVQHTRTATLVRLNVATLGPGVLATASNLECDGGLYRMRATCNQGRYSIGVLDKWVELGVHTLRVGRTI